MMENENILAGEPRWVQDLFGLWNSEQSHTFLLHGEAVDDYVRNSLALRSYLEHILAPRPDGNTLLVFYNRARGIQFGVAPRIEKPNGDLYTRTELEALARERFDKVLGTNVAVAQAAAALASLNPQASQGPMPLPMDPSAVMPLFERVLAQTHSPEHPDGVRLVLVIEGMETLCPNADFAAMSPEDRTMLVRFRSWGRDAGISTRGHIIILVAGQVDYIHPSLRESTSQIRALEVPLPDFDQRLDYIGKLVAGDRKAQEDENEDRVNEGAEVLPYQPLLADEVTERSFAALTAGLPYIGIEDVVLRATYAGEPVSRDLILDRKKQLIRQAYGDVVELLDPDTGFEGIGGMEHVKEWFRRSVIVPFQLGDADRMYKSALLMGPPGTGKTELAKAVAHESGVNCARIDPSQWLGGIVGQTEANTRRALNLCRALTPIVLFVDEVDQALGKRGEGYEGDSGVSRRMFKAVMEFAAEPALRGKVFVLAATNRPDLLDEALIREGRLGDLRIPILAPKASEREGILQVYARRLFGTDLDEATAQKVVSATENWTGAQLERLSRKAWEVRHDNRAADLTAAFDLALSLFHARQTAEVERQNKLALLYCNDDDLLPPEVVAARGTDAELAEAAGVGPADEVDYSKPRGRRRPRA